MGDRTRLELELHPRAGREGPLARHRLRLRCGGRGEVGWKQAQGRLEQELLPEEGGRTSRRRCGTSLTRKERRWDGLRLSFRCTFEASTSQRTLPAWIRAGTLS